MPLYHDYLYGGNSSSLSSPYYSHASTSSSPPSSPYSRVGTHWPIIGYSPLTALLSANISSLNTTPRRSYTPYLSSISEKSPALGRHLFTNRHSPKSKLLYYQSRPVTINTENINLSKDNVKEKKDSVSMSGPIQRGKTVVRMHTKKLKENPGLKKVKKTPGAMLMEKFLIKEPPKEDTYNWREEYNNKKNQMAAKQVSPVRFTTEEEEKVTKNEEEPMIVDEVPPSQTTVNTLPVISPATQQRRMSITDERLQEEAAILDSLIQEEMKEGQKKLEVRRRRKSADLLEEDSSSVVIRRRRKSADLLEEDSTVTEDTTAKKTAKKKYMRQPSGERSSRTLPLDLVDDEGKTNVVEDSKKSVKKRPTVKRKNPLKIVVNEITVEEKVEPKPPRKLNYEVIVEEGKEDSNDEEVVTKVFPRPRPSLAIKRRATIKRMFSRDKDALAARAENAATTQEPKTEKPSDPCSEPSENQEDIPPPVIYRTEFFLKGEDPILEEPEVDIKDEIVTPPVEDIQLKPSTTKIDNKLSGSVSNIDEANKVQASAKPLSKFPSAKDSQEQKFSGSTDSKLGDSSSNENKLNKDNISLKPLSKFPPSKDVKQVKVTESANSVVQDTLLTNQLNDSKFTEKNERNSTTVDKKGSELTSGKKAEEDIKNLIKLSVSDKKPVIPAESANNEESPPAVTYRTEFVLWGSPDKNDQSDKSTEIKGENSKSLFNSNSIDTSKSSTTKEIDSLNKQDSKTDTNMKERSEKQQRSSTGKQQTDIQKPKLDLSPTSSGMNQNSKSEVVSKTQPKFSDKSEIISNDKVPKSVEPEEKPTTTTQEKRKQSIFSDVLVKNDNIKIFGIQVKSDVAPKADETNIDLKTTVEMKPSDPSKVENGLKKNEKTVIPQFLNKNKIEANAKKVDEKSQIKKNDESDSSFLKKNVLESKPLIMNKTDDKQRKEQLNGDVRSLKTETSFTESLPVEKVQKPLPNVSKYLTKTDEKPEVNLIEKSALLEDVEAVKSMNDGKNTGDTKEETLSKPDDNKLTNQLVEKSSASCSPPESPKKTVVSDKNNERLSKDISIQDKNTLSVPDKVKSGTSIQETSKITKPEEETEPSPFVMKTSIGKTEFRKGDKEKVKPNLKLMDGGKISSLDEDTINSEEKHLSTNLPKEESSIEDDASKKEDVVSSPKSTSVLKNQGVSSPTTITNPVTKEVKKDSSKKLVVKTKEKSVTKIGSPVGIKKGSKEINKEDFTKDVGVSKSGVSLVKDKVAVKDLDKVKKLEEKTVVGDPSKRHDNIAEKKTGIVKSNEKTAEKSDSKGIETKKDVPKPVVLKKDVKSGEGIGDETNSRKSGEEKLEIEENRMTVRRRMTKHKTNLSETRMSLMKLEEKKKKESEVRQGNEIKMSKENSLEKKLPKPDNKVEEDVKVEVVPVNDKENEEDAKKEADEGEDSETEEGSSEEEEESTEVESSSEYESDDCDVNCHSKCEKLMPNLCGVNQKLLGEALTSVKRGSAESRERSSGSPLRHLSDTSLGLGGLDEVTTTEVSRCRVTPPATSLPRFRKYSIQDFQFLKVLGKGSFGKVLLAELSGTECYYAVKCLKKDVVLEDDDVECTLIERKVLALGTNHPYLCHLFCTFQTESHLFFVMEYLNGGDLMFHIQQSGRFDEGRARFYASEIVSGLMFLHKKGIVYRDLKLDNILLDFDGHVRIADFGMCKLQIYLDRTADTFCGTPDYMAPEIIKGLAYNQCVDWWSFGILLYEMLVGQSPFSGCDEDDLFWSICNEQPHYPRFLSKESKLILSQLLEKDSSRRLGSSELSGREVTSHVFFRDWDWFRLERRQLDPPFKPRVRHPLDVQYFDKAFTNERPRLTPIDKSILQSMDQTQFQGFSYTNPNVTK